MPTYVDFGRRPKPDWFCEMLQRWEADSAQYYWSAPHHVPPLPRIRHSPDEAGRNRGSWLERAGRR